MQVKSNMLKELSILMRARPPFYRNVAWYLQGLWIMIHLRPFKGCLIIHDQLWVLWILTIHDTLWMSSTIYSGCYDYLHVHDTLWILYLRIHDTLWILYLRIHDTLWTLYLRIHDTLWILHIHDMLWITVYTINSPLSYELWDPCDAPEFLKPR